MEKIKVLVADDEEEIRKLFISLSKVYPEIEVVGVAKNGEEAVKLNKILNPDVIIMDLHMPGTNGIEAIQKIMTSHPKPIIVISGFLDKTKLYSRLKSLLVGAIDVVEKPFSIETIAKKIKLFSEIKISKSFPQNKTNKKFKIVAIGASTGGPEVIRKILQPLPANFPLYIVIAQHISKGDFDKLLVDYLRNNLNLKVELAEEGKRLKKGIVYLAPAERHLEIGSKCEFILKNDYQYFPTPSIDLLFQSVAKIFGEKTIGILLTGMGEDGVKGLKAIKEAGGYTIAQDKNSCVVFGMPKRAIELGIVDKVLPPVQISRMLLNYSKINEY